jgi:hypothetical protein
METVKAVKMFSFQMKFFPIRNENFLSILRQPKRHKFYEYEKMCFVSFNILHTCWQPLKHAPCLVGRKSHKKTLFKRSTFSTRNPILLMLKRFFILFSLVLAKHCAVM